MRKSRKILKNKRKFTRKHKISKKSAIITGGGSYKLERILNAAKFYFGPFSTSRFPIVKITLNSSQKTGTIVGKIRSLGTAAAYTAYTKFLLMTPGTIFKSESLSSTLLERGLDSVRDRLKTSRRAMRSKLFIVIDFILNRKGDVMGIKYLPLYQLATDFKEEKVLLRGNQDPTKANGKKCNISKAPQFQKYETLIQNLTHGQIVRAQTQLATKTNNRVNTVFSQNCSLPETPAGCELGFPKRQDERIVGEDGCYAIVTDVKGVYLNGVVSTKVDDIEIIGYDRIDMNKKCKYLHNIPSLSSLRNVDEVVRQLESLTAACLLAVQQFLGLNVAIKISDRGLTQIAALCDPSYKPDQYILYNATIADDVSVNSDEKAGEIDRSLNQLFGDLVTGTAANPSIQQGAHCYVAANSGMDISVIGDLVCHVVLFRLLNINDYKFEISFPELIFLCKTYVIKSATDASFFTDPARWFVMISQLYEKIRTAVDNNVYNAITVYNTIPPASPGGPGAGAGAGAGARSRWVPPPPGGGPGAGAGDEIVIPQPVRSPEEEEAEENIRGFQAGLQEGGPRIPLALRGSL